MRAFRLFPVLLLFVSVSSFAQSSSEKSKPSFNIDTIDKTLDPCADFYQYACGNWLKTAEIPADQPRWGSFSELHERNLAILRGILEKVSSDAPGRDAIDQKIGDYYSSCMDEKAADAKGIEPLKPELDRIVGSVYAYSERYFAPAMGIGYESKFRR